MKKFFLLFILIFSFFSFSPLRAVECDTQQYSSFMRAGLTDGRNMEIALNREGNKIWYHYQNTDGSWTNWTDQYGVLSGLIPGQGSSQSFSSFMRSGLADGRDMEIALNREGNKIWYHYQNADGSWSSWTDQYGDLSSLIPGQGNNQSFSSFTRAGLTEGRNMEIALNREGNKIWYHYQNADGSWSNWTDQYGDLSSLVPGEGSNQSFSSFMRAGLADGRNVEMALNSQGDKRASHFQTNGSWSDWTYQYGDLSSLVPCTAESYDMSRYWNVKPGNYWVFKGYNYHQGKWYKTRWEVENRTTLCGNNSTKKMWPILITKSSPYAYWGTAFNQEEAQALLHKSNVRLWFTKFTQNCPFYSSQCYGFSYWPIYLRQSEYYRLGELRSTVVVKNDSVPYYQSPVILNNLHQDYITTRQYFSAGETADEETNSNYCQVINNPSSKSFLSEAISYQKANVDVQAYQGETIVIKQGEQNGWATREDWYLAKDIGLVKHQEKTLKIGYGDNRCKDGNGNLLPNCNCQNLFNPTSSDAVDCSMEHLINRPRWSMELSKYYLGNQLQVLVNGQVPSSTLSLTPGETIELTFKDPSTGYTYEGYLEIDSPFISPVGNKKISSGRWGDFWTGENGKIQIQISDNLPKEEYIARFRPWIRRSREGLKAGVENLETKKKLPWSNEVEIKVEADFSCPTCPSGLAKSKGNADCDQDIDLIDFASWLSVFKGLTDNEASVDFSCAENDTQHIIDQVDFQNWLENFLALF